MKDKISIALATYNGERFLREQLDSLYNQTLLPSEVIVCDDCSTDSTIKILEEYHQLHGLKYVINNSPLGVNANFIKAISLCSGDFICICDQDDIWMPNKIKTLYDTIKKYDNLSPNCVSSQIMDIDAQGEILYTKKNKHMQNTEGWQATLIGVGRSQGCTMMINSKLKDRSVYLYESNTLADTMMYDAFIAFIAAIEGNKYNLNTPLMYYRHHTNNVVGKYSDKEYTIFEKLLNLPIYYPFMSARRIEVLSSIYTIYKDIDIKSEIKVFLRQINDLKNTTSFIKGLHIICSMRISIPLKIKTCILSPISLLIMKLH